MFGSHTRGWPAPGGPGGHVGVRREWPGAARGGGSAGRPEWGAGADYLWPFSAAHRPGGPGDRHEHRLYPYDDATGGCCRPAPITAAGGGRDAPGTNPWHGHGTAGGGFGTGR